MQIRRTAAALTCAAGLTISGVAVAAPASAQPVFTGGLVNVNVDVDDVKILNDSLNNNRVLNDVLNDNEVTLGVAAVIIAQVCDTQVGVLAELVQTGATECEIGDGAGSLEFTQA
jgi:hypothetical protein